MPPENEGSERLISLKLSKSDREKNSRTVEPGNKAPEYNYGLTIRLENNELQRLGIKTLPTVGKKIMIEAKAEVVTVSESSSVHNRGDRAVTLQITDMLIEQK